MRKQKIYLETTLFNYYFDKERDAHTDTVRLFNEISEGKYEAFTSIAVTDEINNAPSPKKEMMMALVTKYGVKVLQVGHEAEILADLYVEQGVIPFKYRTDAIHISVASVNELDIIISMNFKHIVRLKTEKMTSAINAVNGYRPVAITSPMEVVENENT